MSEEQENPAIKRMEERQKHLVDPEELLFDAGAVREVDTAEKLKFTEEFEEAVKDELAEISTDEIDAADIAQLFAWDDEDEVTDMDRPYTSWKIDYQIFNWPSEGCLQLDLAFDRALEKRSEDWTTVPMRQRYRILQSLRSFQDDCFFCGGAVTYSDEIVESCCSERQVRTIHCEDCEQRFLEIRVQEEGSGPQQSTLQL